jgi:hypothetical protein
MRLERLINYVSKNAATPTLRSRLGDIMSCGKLTTSTAIEEEVMRDFSALSCSDVGSWITQSSAIELKMRQDSWRPQEHILNLSALASKGNSATHEAVRRVWATRLRGTIGCCTLHHSRDLSVTVFVLPQGTQLDLHDHCGMTVWQCLLFGNMEVLGIDWTEASAQGGAIATDAGRQGVVVQSGVMQQGARHVILPSGGGVVHRVSNPAGSDSEYSVFIDFITPPYYTPPKNTTCTYFQLVSESPHTPLSNGDRVSLKPNPTFSGPDMEALIPIRQ